MAREDHTAVVPAKAIDANGIRQLPQIPSVVEDLQKHIPGPAPSDQEGIGDRLRRYVIHVAPVRTGFVKPGGSPKPTRARPV